MPRTPPAASAMTRHKELMVLFSQTYFHKRQYIKEKGEKMFVPLV